MVLTTKKYPDMTGVFKGMERRAEHLRLKEAVVEAAKAHRGAEFKYWEKLPHERPAILFTKMENARIKACAAVDDLNAFEAEHDLSGKQE